MKYYIKFLPMFFITGISFAQKPQMIKLVRHSNNQVDILANNKPFTSFIYPDSLEKPVLYPIYAADGELITRGYPLAPRPQEPVDHPHHIGLWMNYESVNGLDFWNNSSAIAPDKKPKYGWIKTTSIGEIKSGPVGTLAYSAKWQDINKNTLLDEQTTFHFSAKGNVRIIDRTTTLTAVQDVKMPDIKDGFLGLRVAHELELPSKEDREFTDDKGNITTVKASDDALVSGNYITSEGLTGDAAWGTRGKWCMLYGKKGNDTISIAILDHPKNIGYPTYWHARGYGLFAANPLGQKIFSNGKDVLNYSLNKGEAVTFRFRVVINSAKQRLSNALIESIMKEFEKL
ncbi:MAG: PmoA family protein [Chitinophagaceae bacterium]|nr:PmoA family protein [Chitinophagaceae bacterium]